MLNRHTTSIATLFAIALLLGVTGCSSGPAYVAPTLPANEIVTLKASNAAFISTIDDHEVKGMRMTFLSAIGGNQTTASPGRHRIVVDIDNGNGYSSFATTLDLAPGRTYLFQSKDFGQRVILTNETDNRKWTIDRKTLTAFDPAGKPHPAEEPFAP